MANTQAISRRIKSVKSTRQITKAMELVAASKMRRAQEAAQRTRAYRNTARELLTRLSELTNVKKHPLYAQRVVNNRLYIVISADRGLAGAYNSNILKFFTKQLQNDVSESVKSHAITIGKQAGRFASRLEDLTILGVYEDFPDNPGEQQIQSIIETAQNAFLDKSVDQVKVIYTDFKSSLTQEVELQTIFPAAYEPIHGRKELDNADFEPSPLAVLESITPRLVEAQFLQALLESSASEHSMRMMAMKTASDNAGDLIDDLTLEYNSARQAAITQELAEITGGAEAIA